MKRLFAVVAASLLMLSACGGGDSTPKERPLTSDEAAQLAGVQFANYQAEGATFELNTAFTGTGDTLYLSGEVDWKNHIGHARVAAKGTEASITEVMWQGNAVIERRPSLDVVLNEMGMPNAKFVIRQAVPAKRQLDRAIAIVLSMANAQAENALLIQQKEGSAFLRTDDWRGTEVQVLRYGIQNRFWIETGTSVLRRFDGNSKSGTAPTIIDFVKYGKQSIRMANPKYIVPYEKIQNIYDLDLAR